MPYILFFIATVFFGAFFVINLVLAVVAMSYASSLAETEEEDSDEKAPGAPGDAEDERAPDHQASGSTIEVCRNGVHLSRRFCPQIRRDRSHCGWDGARFGQRSSHNAWFELLAQRDQHPDSLTLFGAGGVPSSLFDKDFVAESEPEQEVTPKRVRATSGRLSRARLLWKRVRSWCLVVVETAWFRNSVILVIVANTVTMAMSYPAMSQQYELALTICNYIFTGLFVIELLLKVGCHCTALPRSFCGPPLCSWCAARRNSG